HPSILLLRLPRNVSASDKKNLLRELEESATLALIEEPAALTAATYDARLKLTQVSGLHGTDGLAWGKTRYDEIRDELIEMVEALEPGGGNAPAPPICRRGSDRGRRRSRRSASARRSRPDAAPPVRAGIRSPSAHG